MAVINHHNCILLFTAFTAGVNQDNIKLSNFQLILVNDKLRRASTETSSSPGTLNTHFYDANIFSVLSKLALYAWLAIVTTIMTFLGPLTGLITKINSE